MVNEGWENTWQLRNDRPGTTELGYLTLHLVHFFLLFLWYSKSLPKAIIEMDMLPNEAEEPTLGGVESYSK